jgi:hypothetical protein
VCTAYFAPMTGSAYQESSAICDEHTNNHHPASPQTVTTQPVGSGTTRHRAHRISDHVHHHPLTDTECLLCRQPQLHGQREEQANADSEGGPRSSSTESGDDASASLSEAAIGGRNSAPRCDLQQRMMFLSCYALGPGRDQSRISLGCDLRVLLNG